VVKALKHNHAIAAFSSRIKLTPVLVLALDFERLDVLL